MGVDAIPYVLAFWLTTVGPLLVGGVFRLRGRRSLARVCAAVTVAICVAACLLMVLSWHTPAGEAGRLVIVQLVAAVGLWALSGSPTGPARGPAAPLPHD